MRRPHGSFPSWTPPHDAPPGGAQRQCRLDGRETHEAAARGQGGVPDRFLGHLYLTLLPGGPILVPLILASGQSTAVAYFAEL